MSCSKILKVGIPAFVFLCAICEASPITVDLTSTLLQGSGGAAVTFSGILSNTASSVIFLGSAGINLAGAFSAADEDLTPFFTNAPLFLSASASTSLIDLFTLLVPSPFATGSYPGTFTILGGTNANATDIVGSAGFTIQVVYASAVPEPSPGALITVSGLSIMIAWIISRRNCRPTELKRHGAV